MLLKDETTVKNNVPFFTIAFVIGFLQLQE